MYHAKAILIPFYVYLFFDWKIFILRWIFAETRLPIFNHLLLRSPIIFLQISPECYSLLQLRIVFIFLENLHRESNCWRRGTRTFFLKEPLPRRWFATFTILSRYHVNRKIPTDVQEMVPSMERFGKFGSRIEGNIRDVTVLKTRWCTCNNVVCLDSSSFFLVIGYVWRDFSIPWHGHR